MLSGMETASPAPSLLNQVSCWYPCLGEMGGATSKDYAGFYGHPFSVGRQSEGGMGMAEDGDDKLKLEYTLYCRADMAIVLKGWKESWTRFKHNATSKKISIQTSAGDWSFTSDSSVD